MGHRAMNINIANTPECLQKATGQPRVPTQCKAQGNCNKLKGKDKEKE